MRNTKGDKKNTRRLRSKENREAVYCGKSEKTHSEKCVGILRSEGCPRRLFFLILFLAL